MILSLFFLLSGFIPQNDRNLEQIAMDYFFENILKRDFPDYKVVEMNDSTYSDPYWGIVHKCSGWSDSLIKDILAAKPSPGKIVNHDKSPVNVKRLRRNSSRLQIKVFSSISIRDQKCVMIIVYRKLRFAEYYYFIFDGSDRLVDYCRVGEII